MKQYQYIVDCCVYSCGAGSGGGTFGGGGGGCDGGGGGGGAILVFFFFKVLHARGTISLSGYVDD